MTAPAQRGPVQVDPTAVLARVQQTDLGAALVRAASFETLAEQQAAEIDQLRAELDQLRGDDTGEAPCPTTSASTT